MPESTNIIVPVIRYQFLHNESNIRHGNLCPSSVLRLSVTLRGPPSDSETGWTGELWSKINLLKWHNCTDCSYLFFFLIKKRRFVQIFGKQLFAKKNILGKQENKAKKLFLEILSIFSSFVFCIFFNLVLIYLYVFLYVFLLFINIWIFESFKLFCRFQTFFLNFFDFFGGFFDFFSS